MQSSPPSLLTPSETVLLRGQDFAGERTLLDSFDLLPPANAKVRASELAENALVAGFLAAERAGVIRLEVAEKRALLGLRKVSTLRVRPGAAASAPSEPPFPPGSFEHAVAEAALRAPKRGKEDADVEEVVHAWLEANSSTPHHAVLDRIAHGLAERKLLDVKEERKLKVFKVRSYEVPPTTAALVDANAAARTRALLDEARQRGGAAWDLLRRGVEKGIRSRRESSDTGPD